MDPNEALAQIRALAAKIVRSLDKGQDVDLDEVDELASAALNLDEWLAKGGFLPRRWKSKR